MFKVAARIDRHPSIETAVEVELTKGGEYAGHAVSVEPTLAESIQKAKEMIRAQYPSILEDDIRVLV
jgi:hypothetical protein